MSIINDALKKTQTELTARTVVPQTEEKPAPPPEKTPEPQPQILVPTKPVVRKKPWPKLVIPKDRLILPLVISACVGLLLAMIAILSWISMNGLPTKHKKTDAIIINGVMIKNNKTVALINNEIYEVGEKIRGMKIVGITIDRIDFLYRGKIKSYKVHLKKEQ